MTMTIKKDIIAALVGIIITITLFGTLYTVKLSPPNNAVVYVDQSKMIYYAPPYIDMGVAASSDRPVDVKALRRMTIKEAQSQKYSPDEVSRKKGYFVQQYRSFSGYLLEKIGLARPLPTRWTGDGAWNW